jgi:hypothetical protein
MSGFPSSYGVVAELPRMPVSCSLGSEALAIRRADVILMQPAEQTRGRIFMAFFAKSVFRARRAVALTLLAGSLGSAGVPSGASAAGLFVGMEGSWRGDGSIEWSTGETERMRCTAKYKLEDDGNKITQNLTCATDSTRLVIASVIKFNPKAGAITGSWSEKTYGITGTVTGRAGTGNIQALVETPDDRFTARVNVRTNGSRQEVTIKPEQLEVRNVSVSLRKS